MRCRWCIAQAAYEVAYTGTYSRAPACAAHAALHLGWREEEAQRCSSVTPLPAVITLAHEIRLSEEAVLSPEMITFRDSGGCE